MSTAEAHPDIAPGVPVSPLSNGSTEDFLDTIYQRWFKDTNGDADFVESELVDLASTVRPDTYRTMCAAAGSLIDGYVALKATEHSDEKTDGIRLYRAGRGAVQNYFKDVVAARQEPNLDEVLDAVEAVCESPRVQIRPAESAGTQRFAFEDIIWRGDGKLYDQAQRPRHLGLLKLLLVHGGKPIIKIHNNYADNMPLTYQFEDDVLDDVLVEFMPHWENNVYEVERQELKLAETAEVLLEDIEAARLNQIFPGSFAAHLTSKQRRYKK